MFVGIVQTKFAESDPEVPILPPNSVIVSFLFPPTYPSPLRPLACVGPGSKSSTGSTATSDSLPTKRPTRNPSPFLPPEEGEKVFGQHTTSPYPRTTVLS